MPRHLTSTSRSLALACSLALIGAGLALGAANATAAPGVTAAGVTSVTQDVPLCAPMPATPVDGVAPAPQRPKILSAEFEAAEYFSSAQATLHIVTNMPAAPMGCVWSPALMIGPSTPAGLTDADGTDTLYVMGAQGTAYMAYLTAHPDKRTTYTIPVTFNPGTDSADTVTVTVTFDGPCTATPPPTPVWTMTTSPTGPLAPDQSYTVTVNSSVDYSACPASAPTVTFTTEGSVFLGMPFPHYSPEFLQTSCQVVGHSCSVTLHSDTAGTYTIHALVNGQDIANPAHPGAASPQQVVWSDDVVTPFHWFTQLLTFLKQLLAWLRGLSTLFAPLAVA